MSTRIEIGPGRLRLVWTLVALLAGCGDGGDLSQFGDPADAGPNADAGAGSDAVAAGPHDVANDVDGTTGDAGADVTGSDSDTDATDASDVDPPDGGFDASDAQDDDMVDPLVPEDRMACETAECWETSASATRCRSVAIDENFNTGLYNVHRYAVHLYAEAANQIALTRTGGSWQPALLLSDADGTPLFDGQVGASGSGVDVTLLANGQTGTTAEIEVLVDADLDAYLFVTGWGVIDSAFVDFLPTDATYQLSVGSVCESLGGLIAPDGALFGERLETGGSSTLGVGDAPNWGPPVRVDAAANEHIGFRLDFSPSGAAIDLQLLAWDGAEAISLGLTNAGPGIRVLAGFDPFQARTFWVRARGTPDSGTLTITPTPIEPGPRCESLCDRLLQLPIPVDAAAQGFDLAPGNRFREQFGRKELMMGLFHAGYLVAAAGFGPFEVQDISNWDGSQPCCHQTHTGGYHADISLLTSGGDAAWYDPGSAFGDVPMAWLLAGFFEAGPYATGNPAEVILDSSMHDDVRAGADTLLSSGDISAATRALFDAELGLIYHYQGHDDHLHVRIDR